MKQAYLNMRNFWLDVKNLENRKGVIEIGPDKISVAGIEMALPDGDEIKHLFLATNSLGDSSLYFENNSKSGLGGVIGGHGHEALQEAAARMLAHASKLTGEMTSVKAGGVVPQLGEARADIVAHAPATFYRKMVIEARIPVRRRRRDYDDGVDRGLSVGQQPSQLCPHLIQHTSVVPIGRVNVTPVNLVEYRIGLMRLSEEGLLREQDCATTKQHHPGHQPGA